MGKVSIDKSVIEELAKLLKENDLSEISIKQGFSSITVARNLSGAVSTVTTSATTNKFNNDENANIQNTEISPGTVTAPMVGTLYISPSPESEAFIKVGSKVKEGDQLFIIEAMKTMNPVRSPFSGKVKKILAKNESPVEFGEILAVIEEDKK